MKYKYLLLLVFVLCTSVAVSQSIRVKSFKKATPKLEVVVPVKGNLKQKRKAYLDTLAYEDFAGQIPTGWTLQNNAINSNDWIWSDQAPGGQYSTNVSALASTSGANGYMLMPADLYNTPIPSGGPTLMDASFTSPALSITPSASVLVRWQQTQAYCCSSTNELVLEVSTDNVIYTAFDAAFGRSANTPETDAMVEINVSSVLANQATAYVRFRMTGASHYYWMIDDVTLLEGPANSMIMTDQYVSYIDSSLVTYNPPFSIVPQKIMDPIDLGGFSQNYGSNTQTGVTMNYEVIHDSTYYGGVGTGLGFQTIHSTTFPSPILSLAAADTIVSNPFVSVIDGHFRARMFVTANSVFQNNGAPTPSSLIEYSFAISDTVLSRSNSPYQGVTGPGNYVGGGNDNERWGSMFTIGQNGAMCTSLSFLVGNTASNEGAQIQPRVWEWSNTATALATAIVEPAVGSSPFTTTIDTSMLGEWISLPLFPPVMLSGQTQYIAGWEQVGGAAVLADFSVARDRVRELIQPDYTHFVYIGGSWGWVTNLGAIRMNFGNEIIGVEESVVVSSFEVSPNPNNGLFRINISNKVATSYNLNVRNMLGQVVYTDDLSVNGSLTQNIDLSAFEKGVYLISVDSEVNSITKKIVLNK